MIHPVWLNIYFEIQFFYFILVSSLGARDQTAGRKVKKMNVPLFFFLTFSPVRFPTFLNVEGVSGIDRQMCPGREVLARSLSRMNMLIRIIHTHTHIRDFILIVTND